MSETAATPSLLDSAKRLLADRIWRNGVLIVVCMVSVLLLSSQSAASYGTYLLALSMLATVPAWKDVFGVRFLWLIAALLAYLSISAFWSDPFEGREFVSVLTRALLVFLFVVAVAECQLRGQVQRWLSRALAVVGFVAVIAAITVFFVTDPADGRLNGLGQLDTHVIAALVWSVLLIFAVQLILTERHLAWRTVGIASALAYAFAIALSDSRTAWVAAIVGTLTYVLSSRSDDVGRFILVACLAGAALSLVIVASAYSPGLSEWLFPRGSSFRPEIWSEAWARITDGNLLFGLGILSSDDLPVGSLVMAHPHNMYLAVTYQGGLVALAVFGATAACTVGIFFHRFEERDAKLGLGVLAVALPSYLLDGHELVDKVGDTWFLFWLPVGLALGLAWRPGYRESMTDG